MTAFLKRMRWAVLVACHVVVVRLCRVLRIPLPMDSIWRPNNLRRFRPYYVAPRTEFHSKTPPQRGR
jgi:hypothetical protein